MIGTETQEGDLFGGRGGKNRTWSWKLVSGGGDDDDDDDDDDYDDDDYDDDYDDDDDDEEDEDDLNTKIVQNGFLKSSVIPACLNKHSFQLGEHQK